MCRPEVEGKRMLKLQIPKNRMNYLIQQAQKRFDPVILERGWDYYHKGKIAQLELRYGTLVYATVLGTEPYEVTVDLEEFANSECSCPYDDACKHIAAVIFSLYTPFGRPELLLQELKQAIAVRSRTARSAAAKAEKTADRAPPPEQNGGPLEWQRFFDQQFYGFSITHQYSIETFYQTAWETLNAFAKSWREPMRRIYQLHVVLFIMRKIEQFFTDTKASYLSYYHETGSKQTAAQCVEKLREVLGEMETERTFAEEELQWGVTLAMLGELALHGKESPVDWLFVYRYIWWGVPLESVWVQHEIGRLDSLLGKTDVPPRKKDALTLARAHFDVMQGRLDEAFHRLGGLSRTNPGDFTIYLQHYHTFGDHAELLRWLRWLKPVMATASHDDFRTFCQYWADAVKHQESDAEWVNVMESLLPRSYYYYTAYLLQTERYQQWVDIQLANRISPLNLYAAELRAVETHDPALLLPLYHQAAERLILEKNRTSYKNALKLLKKLQGYYQKLGREHDWELYIHRLAYKYSRLRAFQEELKKGKWIS
jgi:hypothetical protein